MRFALLVAAAGALGPADLGAQEHAAEPHEHAEGQALANPVEATPESLASGRQRYVFECRQCHGNTGKGDGDMAHAGGVPSDFTDDVWQHGETDGEIFLVIRDGVSADMQGYAGQIPDEDIWHLVNYIRSLR
jgi:mono/diheme cytochrome c family protein